MKRVLAVLVIGIAIYGAFDSRKFLPSDRRSSAFESRVAASPPPVVASHTVAEEDTSFTCDGRQYCSQMSSCAEATYFLQHCPNVKMDGDHDGVPCEDQWCGH